MCMAWQVLELANLPTFLKTTVFLFCWRMIQSQGVQNRDIGIQDMTQLSVPIGTASSLQK
jgi:hypothetical protein